jgi:hypothetical protein
MFLWGLSRIEWNSFADSDVGIQAQRKPSMTQVAAD